jgi:AraC family transcriptional regulator
MKKLVFLVFTSAIVFCATIFFRLGGYKTIEVSIKPLPAMYLLYKEHLGPYHEIEATIEEIELWAKTHNISCTETFGKFIDDPRTTDERHLRAHVGCVSMTPLTDPGPYTVENLAAQNYVWAEFDGAPSIGPLKVYPKIHDFIASHHLKPSQSPIEIYIVKNGGQVITQYLFGLGATAP